MLQPVALHMSLKICQIWQIFHRLQKAWPLSYIPNGSLSAYSRSMQYHKLAAKLLVMFLKLYLSFFFCSFFLLFLFVFFWVFFFKLMPEEYLTAHVLSV